MILEPFCLSTYYFAIIRDEITIMTERKLDLERRIEALYSEREGLSTTLDESADRIVMLEKESREQDSMVEFPIQIFSTAISVIGYSC